MGKCGDMGPNWEDVDAFLSVDESTQIPATGAELELALGYDGELVRVGGFVVDEIEISGWPGELVVRARAAAQAEYGRRARRRATLSLSMPGRADVMAEGRLDLVGFRPGADGTWIVTRTEHGLDDGGYRTDIEAEQERFRAATPEAPQSAADS